MEMERKTKRLTFFLQEKEKFFFFDFVFRLKMMIIMFREFVFDKIDNQSGLAHIYMPIAWNVFRFQYIILSIRFVMLCMSDKRNNKILFINFNNEIIHREQYSRQGIKNSHRNWTRSKYTNFNNSINSNQHTCGLRTADLGHHVYFVITSYWLMFNIQCSMFDTNVF